MAGGVGDGCVGEGRFFLLLDCLVVGEHAGEDEEWNEEVKQVVDMQSPEDVICFFVAADWLGVADDRDIIWDEDFSWLTRDALHQLL